MERRAEKITKHIYMFSLYIEYIYNTTIQKKIEEQKERKIKMARENKKDIER